MMELIQWTIGLSSLVWFGIALFEHWQHIEDLNNRVEMLEALSQDG